MKKSSQTTTGRYIGGKRRGPGLRKGNRDELKSGKWGGKKRVLTDGRFIRNRGEKRKRKKIDSQDGEGGRCKRKADRISEATRRTPLSAKTLQVRKREFTKGEEKVSTKEKGIRGRGV